MNKDSAAGDKQAEKVNVADDLNDLDDLEEVGDNALPPSQSEQHVY